MRILMTGAAGRVGGFLRPRLRARYGRVVLSDRNEIPDLHADEELRIADLGDAGAVAAACRDVDGIIHLAGQPTEADWPTVCAANVQGAINLFEAARELGVPRIVFASSHHTVGMYPRRRRFGVDKRVRPDTRYGVSKVFGEALASYYADNYGLRTLSIRIGNVAEKPADVRGLSHWVHPDDLMQLVALGLEAPDLHCEVVYGISANAAAFWDNETAFRLGYRPQHAAESHQEHARAGQAKLPPDPVGDRLQGGIFCAHDFDGDLERILKN